MGIDTYSKLLEPKRFIKPGFWYCTPLGKSKSPLKFCNICVTDIVKVRSVGSFSFCLSVYKTVHPDHRSFKFARLVGVTISGVWHFDKGLPGSAVIALVDSRITDVNLSILSKVVVSASQAGEFQFTFSPNFSITMNDLKKNPIELIVDLQGLPLCDGFEPLSLELGFLFYYSDSALSSSLGAKIKLLQSETNVESGDIPDRVFDEVVSEVDLSSVIPKARNLRNALSVSSKSSSALERAVVSNKLAKGAKANKR